ncbi:MAG: toxin-antitoxin system YwqK family antitoxin [Phycisphaerae bacterium]|nr:toxin-antitoxin system YwqK family antitoxin [Phycisphaerae bacterium]
MYKITPPSGRIATFALAGLMLVGVNCQQGGRRAESGVRADQVEVVTEQWPDGSPRLRKQVLHQPDGSTIDHGAYERWHRNGKKAHEALYVHGHKDGVAREWHDNGQLWSEEHYRDGQRDGIRRVWDPNGNLRKEERYREGKPCGTWTVWGGDGRVKATQNHGEPEP